MYRMNTSISAPKKQQLQRDVAKLDKLISKEDIKKQLLTGEIKVLDAKIKEYEEEIDTVFDKMAPFDRMYKVYKTTHKLKAKKQQKFESSKVNIETLLSMKRKIEQQIYQ